HELGRRLDQAPIALVGRKLRTCKDRPHQRLDVVLAAAKRVAEAFDVARAGPRGHEVLGKLVGDERGGGGLSEGEIDYALRIYLARLAEVGDASSVRPAR